MKRIVLIAALLVSSACVKAPPTLTPAGVAAFNGTRVVKALDVLRDSAIAANAQVPPLLSTATTRKVVTYHESALKTIQAAPSGWVPTVQAGLTEVGKDLPPAEQQQLGPYLALVQTLIMEVAK
jgi:hypothetical protein